MDFFFNEKLDNYVPKNVTHLTLGNLYKQIIDGNVFDNIMYLSLSSKYPFDKKKNIKIYLYHYVIKFKYEIFINISYFYE